MTDVLISGGTGLIGRHLTGLLQKNGYKVKYLSREPEKAEDIEAFHWDVNKQQADAAALENTGTIIQLAGANVGEKRWTAKRKELILQSRTRSVALLRKMLTENDHNVHTFIVASAIGYYGCLNDGIKTEESSPGDDFLADVTRSLEDAVDQIPGNIRIVKIRIGIVLTMEGGAMEAIARPVKYYIGAPLGSGKQWMSWIHIEDVGRLFLHAIQNTEMSGAYNGVTPTALTNKEFTQELANVMHRPLFLPNVPQFVMKLMVGEMAVVVLGGNRISAEKTIASGFSYDYPELIPALIDLLH